MKSNNKEIKILQDAIEANKQFIYHHDQEVHKNTKEISILAKRNVNMLDIRNRMATEVEKLEKELAVLLEKKCKKTVDHDTE